MRRGRGRGKEEGCETTEFNEPRGASSSNMARVGLREIPTHDMMFGCCKLLDEMYQYKDRVVWKKKVKPGDSHLSHELLSVLFLIAKGYFYHHLLPTHRTFVYVSVTTPGEFHILHKR